jgi:hypothetical protein
MAKGQAVGLERGHVVSKREQAKRPAARKGVRGPPAHARWGLGRLAAPRARRARAALTRGAAAPCRRRSWASA